MLDAQLIDETDLGGVFALDAAFEAIVASIGRAITRLATDETSATLRFPPILSSTTIDRAQYRALFPHLLGEVHAEPPGSPTGPATIALAPAACYHVYPLLERSAIPDAWTVDVESWCFRNESATSLSRLRAFRMRELVYFGRPDAVTAWHEAWKERAAQLFGRLGVLTTSAPASDPFFGRRGRILADAQIARQLKTELKAVIDDDQPTAIASFNHHRDHFAKLFSLRLQSDGVLHSACVGFGMERAALALLRAHGPRTEDWPDGVRRALA